MLNQKSMGIIHGIIPAFFLALSVGQIYAFTNFSSEIAVFIERTQNKVQFAFSLGIFFLGMGAAFFGKIVEKDIRKSTLIGTALFLAGMFFTAVSIRMHSLIGIYIGYGLFIGLGTGIIYISPVKTMMLWFKEHKALAAAIPIIFFGLGSTFSTVLYSCFISYGIENIFFIFGYVYTVLLAIGILLLKKPVQEKEISYTDPVSKTDILVSNHTGAWFKHENPQFTYGKLLCNRFFIHSWIFMFLNISSGLCLIPLAKQMMNSSAVGYSAAIITAVIGLCGIMNGSGRFIFAFISDKLENRIKIIAYIIGISLITMICTYYQQPVIGVSLLIINACYGAGFSVIPAILADHFGMSNISKIHGAVLSAWGFAGLAGNQLAMLISDRFGFGNTGVILMLIVLYGINFINFIFMRKLFKLNTFYAWDDKNYFDKNRES